MSTPAATARSGLFPFGVALAVGMVLSASIASRTFERVKSANTVTVKGYAEKKITSDMAAWWGSFSARNSELILAYEKLESDLAVVLAYLDKNGFKRGAVNVSAVSTNTQYKNDADGNRTNQIEYYVLSRSVDVTSADLALVTSVSKGATSLIKDGIEFRSGNPQFFYTGLDDLKIEMLAAATADARSRAEEIARGSRAKIGALRSAQQGVFQITTPYSTEVSGYGVYDTSTANKLIKAIVTVEYSLR